MFEISLESLNKLSPQPLVPDATGYFPFPRERYGIIACFIDSDDQLVWGGMESNRIGPTTIAPPAGVPDILAIKENQYYRFEAAKALPEFHLSFLDNYVGQLVRDMTYQQVLTRFKEQGFNLYLEHALTTAIGEVAEEHGLNLSNTLSSDRHLLHKLYQLPSIVAPGIQDSKSQQFWLALLHSNKGVCLKDTTKLEQKIRRNKGRQFYEKGRWGTLAQFKDDFEHAFLQALEWYQLQPEKLELLALFLESHWQMLQLLTNLESQLRDKLLLTASNGRLATTTLTLPNHRFFSAHQFLTQSQVSRYEFSQALTIHSLILQPFNGH